LYLKGVNQNAPNRENEILTSTQKLNEFIMISLRTKEGMDLNRVEKEFGLKEKERIENQIEKFRARNLIHINNSFIQLTDQGMLRADGIASELFA
jgi:oxygen-independent coproporphyrinogen-3 oxidase